MIEEEAIKRVKGVYRILQRDCSTITSLDTRR